MSDLAGRVALITGGGSGIGQATAERLAQAGAAIVVADLVAERASGVAAGIAANGGQAHGLALDVRDQASCEAAVATALERYGRLDILVNSAGVARSKPVLDLTLDDWETVLAVNLTGTFLCAQAAARVMAGAGRGRIINIASVSGLLGGVRRAAYGASKGGVIMLTRVMATELAASGITVNAIAPGPVETPFVAGQSASERSAWFGRIPAGRYATAAEIAAAALYLASDEASFVNGHVLTIDGGFTSAGLLPEG